MRKYFWTKETFTLLEFTSQHFFLFFRFSNFLLLTYMSTIAYIHIANIIPVL